MWFVLQNYGGIEVRENKKRTKIKQIVGHVYCFSFLWNY